MKRLALSLVVLAAACGGSSTSPTTEALPSVSITTIAQPSAIDVRAADLCAAGAWTGIAETSFQAELDARPIDGVTAAVLSHAVRATCPDSVYTPLSQAEIDWCGNGIDFSVNFFNVVEAGIDLGLPSFRMVEAGLLAKVTRRGSDPSEYELELIAAELETMVSTSGFARDWAAACRSTL